MDDVMIYQIVQGTSRRKRFKFWVVTIGVGCNVHLCFN
jgi:hypothetical protein